MRYLYKFRYKINQTVFIALSPGKVLWTILFFLLVSGTSLYAQKEMLKEIFTEAESHFLFGEYTLANPLYLMLNDNLEDNANIQYKIGVCYLNIPHEKEKAIPYLEAAVKNASYDAHEELFSETRAPLDAFFYLGNAYRINNQIDKALNTYKQLKKLLTDKNKMVNEDFIDQQIVACRNALKLMKKPVGIKKTNLGKVINLTSINIRPVISGDGNTLVFTAKFGEDNIVYYTRKEYGQWLPPSDITDEIGSDRDCSPTGLNYDGSLILLYKLDQFAGNIYESRLNGDHWSKIQKLNKNINTKYYESHASISRDESTLYFTSNRAGGIGALDIYISKKTEKGDWGSAINLGPSVNTQYNEDCPFITMNDSFLYFSSEGHYNIGGYDIFRSKHKGSEWGEPENLGYPLNTTDDDLYFQPFNNGQSGYYAFESGYKEMEIFRIDFLERRVKRVFETKGLVTILDTTYNWLSKVRFAMIDSINKDTVDMGKPNSISGWYYTRSYAGVYNLNFYGSGILPHQEVIEIPEDAPNDAIIRNVTLEIDTAYVPERVDTVKIVHVIDTTNFITNLVVMDPDAVDKQGREILYYTVQLMALLNPVDVSYFKNLDNVEILHGKDAFYRYTYGRYQTLEEAEAERQRILGMGYADVFVKKVYRESEDKPQK
ncbi:MAG: hypothetical protein GXO83_06340 [Chlorobi bacterium]|nr:hypothetical protein [Chlorobiota bacterium]